MKKITLACALASALIMNCTNASASTVFQLNETFQSGATFAGSVTFSDALDNLLGVTGTLVGGSVGATSDKVNWTWYEGGSQKASGTFAANTNAHFDWLMDGTNSSNYSHRIELDWINTGGVITLTNAYGSGSSGSKANAIDSWDPMVSYGITAAVPEPEAYGMLLVGLGLLGFVANRRKSRS